MKKKIGKDLLDAKPSQQLFPSQDSSPLGIGIIYTQRREIHWLCPNLDISTQLGSIWSN